MTLALTQSQRARRQTGFTLIEMMVAIAVLAILLAIAVPSFNDFRQRSAVRGAAEQLTSVLSEARFEALKRNTSVTVLFKRGSANTAWCAGAVTGTAACDCFEKDPANSAYCAVALYPGLDNGSSATGEAQATAANRGVSMTTDPSSAMAGDGIVTFDPLNGALANLADGGSITLVSASSNYQLQFTVNGLGRATMCVPSGSRGVIGYSSC